MSATPVVLFGAKYLADTDTEQYMAPAACTAVRVDDFLLVNRSASAATVIVRVVPNGETPGPEHEVRPSKSLAAGEEYLLPPMYLRPQESIRTTAGTASAIVGRASGRVIA